MAFIAPARGVPWECGMLLRLPRLERSVSHCIRSRAIGLDIAKSVFQVHGVDAAGEVVIRRQLKRRSVLAFFQKLPRCLVGIEACASVAPLVARTPSTWPHRTTDAASLREALRQASEERCS